MYKYDMSQEGKQELLGEGWHTFYVANVEEKISKAGNPMFVWTLREKVSGQEMKVFTVSQQGKRWLLKQALAACGVKIGNGQVYTFELKDLLDKQVDVRILHEQQDYINRKGEMAKQIKAKAVEFRASEVIMIKGGMDVQF